MFSFVDYVSIASGFMLVGGGIECVVIITGYLLNFIYNSVKGG